MNADVSGGIFRDQRLPFHDPFLITTGLDQILPCICRGLAHLASPDAPIALVLSESGAFHSLDLALRVHE